MSEEKEIAVIETQAGASAFVARIQSVTTAEQQQELLTWLRQLADVRASRSPMLTKGVRAVSVTVRSKAIWPTIRILFNEIQHFGWDQRSWAERAGIGGIVAGVALGGGAGIAALGGAIGVPLWLVLGAGGYTLAGLIKAFSAKDKD